MWPNSTTSTTRGMIIMVLTSQAHHHHLLLDAVLVLTSLPPRTLFLKRPPASRPRHRLIPGPRKPMRPPALYRRPSGHQLVMDIPTTIMGPLILITTTTTTLLEGASLRPTAALLQRMAMAPTLCRRPPQEEHQHRFRPSRLVAPSPQTTQGGFPNCPSLRLGLLKCAPRGAGARPRGPSVIS